MKKVSTSGIVLLIAGIVLMVVVLQRSNPREEKIEVQPKVESTESVKDYVNEVGDYFKNLPDAEDSDLFERFMGGE